MQALMLAAGMGKRLGKYTKNATKCMVPVNGKTLIENAIESLLDAGINKLIMVVGYKSEVLKTFLSGKYPTMNIEFIDNPVYNTTNNIYSLYLAKNALISDDTILLESDLIFDKDIIKELLSNPADNLAVVSPFEPWMDGTVTILNDKNEIAGILGKSDFVWNNTKDYYKTVNIYKLSKDFSKNVYIPFLDAYQKAYGKNEYYETVLKVISFLDNTMLKAHIVDGARWYEIDDPADLAIAETRFADGKSHLALMQQTYGGYWRYPSMLDYCYLVNPYFPPSGMIKELSASFETLLRNYPSGDKQQSLLAGKIFGLEPEHIAVGNGAAELIAALSEIIDGKVVVPFPTFNEYPNRFGENRTVWMDTDDNFSYTVEDVIRTADNTNAKFVLLINPENPSGHFFYKDKVLKLAAKLKAKNKYLIFDESFIDFAESKIRYTFLDETLLAEYPNVIVVKSISKSYGVPGLRLGVLANADNNLIRNIQKKTAIWNINSFGEYFLQIFDKYKKHYAAACDMIAAERQRFIEELSKLPNIKVYPSQANYVLCQLTSTLSSGELAESLLDRYNILIKDLSSKKGFNGRQFIRLAVRDEVDNTKLTAAMQNILPKK